MERAVREVGEVVVEALEDEERVAEGSVIHVEARGT